MAVDTHPGIGPSASINRYWLAGEGLAKWADSPHPYETLVALLEAHVSSAVAHGLAAEYYRAHFGRPPGAHHGGKHI
jgi:hypothetical protein